MSSGDTAGDNTAGDTAGNTADTAADPAVARDAAAARYTLSLDGVVIGFADYVDHETGVREFPHTVVSSEYGGRGYAAKLVRAALDDTRSEGKTVRPSCSYVARFIEKNPEFADLLA